MRKWYRKFKSCLGKPISIADKALENKVDTIIQCDRKARLSDIVYQVNAAYGTVQNIVTEILKYWKICTRCIPHTRCHFQKESHTWPSSHFITYLKNNLFRYVMVLFDLWWFFLTRAISLLSVLVPFNLSWNFLICRDVKCKFKLSNKS